MKRPQITFEMKLEAARQVATKLDGADAETIAKTWQPHMDGYELARELDKNYYWDLTRDEMEQLDDMGEIVNDLLSEAEKQWFEENNIQPPLPIGTRIKEGVIAGIDKYGVARYLVKENGCIDPNRHLLIKFEAAEAV